MLDAVVVLLVRVETFSGCCERFRSGLDGREIGVVANVVEADVVDPTTVDDDGGGIVGIGMCFNIYNVTLYCLMNCFTSSMECH